MAINYTWRINALEKAPTMDDINENELTDVVTIVHYTYIGTSTQTDSEGNLYTADNIGTISLGTPDQDDFVAFDDLTQAEIESWLTAELNTSDMQTSIQAAINEKITPTSITVREMPWS
jgi:hypothetical protein|tara:strand:- start:328 stop:684 length:357 start_codon:yes stop_codon:yes gene_type:complete